MKFRTEITIPKPSFTLTLSERGVLLGSCFSDEIGRRMLTSLRWDVAVNPCGTLFNPESIARLLKIARGEEQMRFLERNGVWHCMELSSAFSSPQREICERKSRESVKALRDALAGAGFLIVTLGSAWVYRMMGETVGNCHKIEASRFLRLLLTVEETIGSIESIIRHARNINPDLKIIFTVSPVRHIGETLHGNNLSKSTLLLAVDKICRRCVGTEYFPAYEILIDDLRDYRFYAADLCHPSSQGADYVWEKFLETFLSGADRALLPEITSLIRRLSHRPLIEGLPSPDASPAWDAFLASHPSLCLLPLS